MKRNCDGVVSSTLNPILHHTSYWPSQRHIAVWPFSQVPVSIWVTISTIPTTCNGKVKLLLFRKLKTINVFSIKLKRREQLGMSCYGWSTQSHHNHVDSTSYTVVEDLTYIAVHVVLRKHYTEISWKRLIVRSRISRKSWRNTSSVVVLFGA